jgi:hypothetical protein
MNHTPGVKGELVFACISSFPNLLNGWQPGDIRRPLKTPLKKASAAPGIPASVAGENG